MEVNNTPTALALAVTSIVTLAAALTGSAMLVGFGGVVMVSLLGVIGFRVPSGRPNAPAQIALAVWCVAFCTLIAFAYWLHDPSGPLRTIGAIPAGTAMLIYGLPPLGLLVGLLYGALFDRVTLPEDRLASFLQRHGR